MDLSPYLTAFRTEAQELLQTLNQALLDLEKDPAASEAVESMFRAAHTLKGMSATMGYSEIAELTHGMEDLMDQVRNKKRSFTPASADAMFAAVDALETMITEAVSGEETSVDISGLLGRLHDECADGAEPGGAAPGSAPEAPPTPGSAPGSAPESASDSPFTDDERRVMAEAAKAGLRSLQIKIRLASDCVLKGVRAYMVIRNLTSIGEILKSTPSTQEIEDELFDVDFELVLLSAESAEKIEKEIRSVGEIEAVDLAELEVVAPEPREHEGEPAQRTAPRTVPKIQKTQTVRVNIGQLDGLMNLVGELVINRARLEKVAGCIASVELAEVLDELSMITGELQVEVMQARMVQVGQIFDRFPRVVRDLARQLNKEVEFKTEGTEIELDRSVLDEIGDPLIHLLRNAVDHGVESPEERERTGKPRMGSITLSARREKQSVLIEVEDDGGGIDPGRMREVAVKKGFFTEDGVQALSDEECVSLVCMPGFTSGDQVTAVSGRGVGVDAVKERVEGLGGSLAIRSELGKGTCFTLTLPLTLAIVQALLVDVAGQVYALPLSNVSEIVEQGEELTKTIRGESVIVVHDQVIPLISLRQVFAASDSTNGDVGPVVIVEVGGKRKGLVVDRMAGQQEVVIKPLDEVLKGVAGLAGATILGDGQVALILDARSLV